MILEPGQTHHIRVDFLNEGTIVAGTPMTLLGSMQEIRGNIAMTPGGIFYFTDGILDWTRDATLSGDVTIRLYKDEADKSYVYATTNDPETTFTIRLARGVHELEIDGNSGINISVIGRSGYRYNWGRLYVNGTSDRLPLHLLDISEYTTVLVATDTTLSTRKTILGENGAIRGPGGIVTETLEWQSGSISSGIHVRVTGLSQIGSGQQIPRLSNSNVTIEGPAIFTESTQITFENSWIEIVDDAVVENDLQIYPTGSSTWSTMQILGRIVIASEPIQLSLLVDVHNEGQILAASNNLAFRRILHSGVIQAPGIMTLRNGGQSVFTGASTSIFEGTLEIKASSELVIDTDQASFRLHGISGRLVVPAGIRLVLPFVRIETGFELNIEGTLMCDELYLNGGLISGSGKISCSDVEWTEGTFSIGNLNETSSGMNVTHLLTVRSTLVKTLQGGILKILDTATIFDSASIVLQGWAILENQGSLTCLRGSMIQGDDDGSVLVNNGDINILAGHMLSSSKIHCSLQSHGNIAVSVGTAELGLNGLNCSVIGSLYVLSGAALVFSGGTVVVESMADFRVDGIFRSVSEESGTFVVRNGENPFYLASVEISSGTISIHRLLQEPVRSARCTGGTLLVESQLSFTTLWVQGGILLIRSQVRVSDLFFWLGTIESDKRQSRVTASYIEWFAGLLLASPGKRFLVEGEQNIIISGSGYKEIRNDAVLTVKKSATFHSITPINLLGGSRLVVEGSATLTIISGTVTTSSDTGMIQNDGTIMIGIDELTSSRASFDSFLSNNGRIIVTNTEVSFQGGGDLGGSGVFFHNGSTLELESGRLIISPESLEVPLDITVNGGILVLQSGQYDTEFHVSVRKGLLAVIATDIEDPATRFPGDIDVRGGTLNITGDLRMMGNMHFTHGAVIGTGEIYITTTGELEVRYSLSISDSRSLSVGLLSSQGITRLFSPLYISSNSVFKIADASTTYLMSYTDLLGDGTALNVGTLAVDVHPEHISRMGVNFYNHWIVDGRQGRLWLSPTGNNRVLLEDTSQITGNGTIVAHRVYLGGMLDGETWLQGGDIYVREPCYVTGTSHWISGQIHNAGTQCTSSSLIVSSCHESFIFVQGTLIIENAGYVKYVNQDVVIINNGSVVWREGRLSLNRMTFVNNGEFLMGPESSNLRLERWVSYRQPLLENHGTMAVRSSNVLLQARVTNTGVVSVNSLTTLSLEAFEQNGATAAITGTDATLAGAITISRGDISWSGAITGGLSINNATLTTRGKNTLVTI